MGPGDENMIVSTQVNVARAGVLSDQSRTEVGDFQKIVSEIIIHLIVIVSSH